jgi:hypothetical protein
MKGFVPVGGPVLVTVVACASVYGSPITFHNVLDFFRNMSESSGYA